MLHFEQIPLSFLISVVGVWISHKLLYSAVDCKMQHWPNNSPSHYRLSLLSVFTEAILSNNLPRSDQNSQYKIYRWGEVSPSKKTTERTVVRHADLKAQPVFQYESQLSFFHLRRVIRALLTFKTQNNVHFFVSIIQTSRLYLLAGPPFVPIASFCVFEASGFR